MSPIKNLSKYVIWATAKEEIERYKNKEIYLEKRTKQKYRDLMENGYDNDFQTI